MRETVAALHRNRTRDNNNSLISVSSAEGLTKKRSCQVVSVWGKRWEASAIGNILFLGRTVIGGRVAEEGDIILPWKSKTCAIALYIGMVGVRYNRTMEMVEVGGDAVEMQDYKGRRREE